MSLEISFKGKKVLVTGGGNGIGRQLCEKLHEMGALVWALCKNQEWLSSLAAEKPGIQTICVDLEDWAETRKAIENLEVVKFDCLVNNAGIGGGATFMQITPDMVDKQMSVNVKAIINVSQVVSKGMIELGGGSIVNISSLGSRYPIKISPVYSLTKASVDMLTKAMAVELGPKNIRVNGVNPTIVQTDMGASFGGKSSGEGNTIYDKLISRTPYGRVANKTEIVNTILFLLSDTAPMIHGESVFVDGGYSCY